MDIGWTKGNSHLIQRTEVLTVRRIMRWSRLPRGVATSPAGETLSTHSDELPGATCSFQRGSSCKAGLALSREVSHMLTPKAPSKFSYYENVWNTYSYSSSRLAKNLTTQRTLHNTCIGHTGSSQIMYNFIYSFFLFFFILVVAGHRDSALGLRIFHSTIICKQYKKYKQRNSLPH